MDNNNRRKFLKDSGMLLGGLMLSGSVIGKEAGLSTAFGGTEPLLGEICMFPYDFAPKGWMLCDGSLLPVNSNQALFSLLGTFYGGNGITNFALPNLQGHTPIGFGTTPNDGYNLGQVIGAETVTLTSMNLPAHIHGGVKMDVNRKSGTEADSNTPVGSYPMQETNQYGDTYDELQDPLVINNNEVQVGGNIPHLNMQPYAVMGFYIATNGIYPPRS